MKKLIMAAAIVCAVCSVKAAQVAWNAYQYAGGEQQDYGYFVDASGTPYTVNPVDICLCLMNTDGSVKQVLDTGVNDGAGAVGGNYAFEYASSVIKNGDILKVMAKDDKGNFSDLVAAANAEGNDPTVFNTLTVSGLSDDTWTNDEFVYATGNFTAAAAPEPTSGLLLLLGMAGLALRRRRA